jgi:hypothetical protein
MNTYLYDAWRTGKKPFAEETLHPMNDLPLNELSHLLSIIGTSLHQEYENDSLLRLSDWHEHDGYITQSQPVEWVLLHSLVASSNSLFQNGHQDEYVRWGFYEPQGTFYLRIWIPDEQANPSEAYGSFDLSGSTSLIQKMINVLALENLRISNAKRYFDTRYGG